MGLQLPREPRQGQPLDWAWGAALVRYIRSITPRSSSTVRVKQLSGGSTFDAASPAAVQSLSFPFQVIDATNEDDGAQVSVRFGQVNSVTPTIEDVELDVDPAPLLAVVTGVVFLHVTLDEDGAITAAAIENAAELPDQEALEAYLTIATITVEDDLVTAINQSVMHSLGHRRCGVNDQHFWAI